MRRIIAYTVYFAKVSAVCIKAKISLDAQPKHLPMTDIGPGESVVFLCPGLEASWLSELASVPATTAVNPVGCVERFR